MPIRPDFFDTQTLAIVRRKIGIRAANATLDSAMRQDLQCDSLDYIEVAHALEDGFGIELTDNDIETAETIGDYAATVRHRVAESYTLPPAQPPGVKALGTDRCVYTIDENDRIKRVLPCPITHDQLLAYNAKTPA